VGPGLSLGSNPILSSRRARAAEGWGLGKAAGSRNDDEEDELTQEIEAVTARIMRLLADMVVEDKRAVVTEIDRLVAFEEASHARAEGQEH
jgi:hypothetical protein